MLSSCNLYCHYENGCLMVVILFAHDDINARLIGSSDYSALVVFQNSGCCSEVWYQYRVLPNAPLFTSFVIELYLRFFMTIMLFSVSIEICIGVG